MKTDYNRYQFSYKEWLLFLAESLALCLLAAYLFYDRPSAALPLLALTPFLFRWQKDKKIRERKMRLRDGFQELLSALLFAYRAGRATETAFPEAGSALREMLEPSHPLLREWKIVTDGMRVSIPAEKLLRDFADRSGVEEIEDFASVFAAAKRSGGNMAEVIENTAGALGETIRTRKEIEAAIAAKKAESRIMAVMPAGIILYMRLGSPGYLDALYGTPAGILVMTFCLLIYGGALWLGEHLTAITV